MSDSQIKKAQSVGSALLAARAQAMQRGEHNMELVAEKEGAVWINNSMATTVDLTWDALRDVNGPVLLIIGGIDRNNDYGKLKNLVAEKVKAVIFLGGQREKYMRIFQPITNGLIVDASTLHEAVEFANAYAWPGDTVLFSPSCPSYHAFDNYKNRGNDFKISVRRVLGE